MRITCSKSGLKSLPPFFTPASTSRIVKSVLRGENKRVRGDINIVFVDSKTIRLLNRRFLDKSGLTDVIAFPYDGSPASDPVFGDIYIAVPVAKRNAARFQDSFRREMTRLVVHGVLHLLGYDDHRANDRKRMWARQEPLVERLSRSPKRKQRR